MDDWVVFIGAGKWQYASIEKVHELGYKTLVFDGDCEAPGFEIATVAKVQDIRSDQNILDDILSFFSKKDKVLKAVLCPVNEAGQLTAAMIRTFLNLPGIDFDTAKKLTNKADQRYLWKDLNSPGYIIFHKEEFDSNLLKQLRSNKIIVKPVDSSGSRGITVTDKNEIRNDFILNSLEYSKSGMVIVEEYVEGIEFTVDGLRIENETFILMVTEKMKVENTNNTVANCLISQKLEDDRFKTLFDLISAAHDALGYQNGVFHTEVILDSDGKFWLIETAGRGAGFGVSELFIPFVTNYDFCSAAIKFDLGMRPDEPSKLVSEKYCAVRFIESREGIFSGILNAPTENFYCLKDVGSVLSLPVSDGDRVAFFFKKSEDLESLKQTIQNEMERICVLMN